MKLTAGLFESLCLAHGLPKPIPEHKFHSSRDWRFDWFFNVGCGIALEIEGGVWASKTGNKSRHFHGKGALGDMEKYNEAAILGICVLRVSTEQFTNGAALELVRRAIEARTK